MAKSDKSGDGKIDKIGFNVSAGVVGNNLGRRMLLRKRRKGETERLQSSARRAYCRGRDATLGFGPLQTVLEWEWVELLLMDRVHGMRKNALILESLPTRAPTW
ncbi:hypothetical protein OOU_Y34scaffold00126g97 [Pyricularia oryzae Y34]|uniref:Uncharacterized protein n=2 Tax=Pyricularia oryzae TaxID=318829 RepID=A0AA97PR57_PYRO3|nr:hypothetical protein OOU_Y34scaffold00126g97 [Pyricularia oryzae Y34]